MISDQDIKKKLEMVSPKDKLSPGLINILKKCDDILEALHGIREDYAVRAEMMEKHTRQIEALAMHTGMVLPD